MALPRKTCCTKAKWWRVAVIGGCLCQLDKRGCLYLPDALAGDVELGGQAVVGPPLGWREGAHGEDELAALVNLGEQFRG